MKNSKKTEKTNERHTCNVKLLSKHTNNNQTNLIELWVEWARPRNTHTHTYSRMRICERSQLHAYQSFLQRFKWTFLVVSHRKKKKKQSSQNKLWLIFFEADEFNVIFSFILWVSQCKRHIEPHTHTYNHKSHWK